MERRWCFWYALTWTYYVVLGVDLAILANFQASPLQNNHLISRITKLTTFCLNKTTDVTTGALREKAA
jgi:hypothetical protein